MACSSTGFAVAPPSTRSSGIASPASASAASSTARVWNASASSVARTTCAPVECRRQAHDRAAGRGVPPRGVEALERRHDAHAGARVDGGGDRCGRGGSRGGCRARRRASRRRCRPPRRRPRRSGPPARRPPGRRARRAVRRPARAGACRRSRAGRRRCRRCTSPRPGGRQAWPSSAACWSPTSASSGRPASGPAAVIVGEAAGAPRRHDLGQDGARDPEQREQLVVPLQARGVEQQRARRVRDVGDVAAGERLREPAVDRAGGAARRARPGRGRRRRCRAARRASWRRSRAAASVRCAAGRAPRRRPPTSSAQVSAVRASCQTRAGATGRPVARSQTTIVSRWFAIPTPATRARSTSREHVGGAG